MKRASEQVDRLPLGRVSMDTKGASGTDIEMMGLWHKPALPVDTNVAERCAAPPIR